MGSNPRAKVESQPATPATHQQSSSDRALALTHPNGPDVLLMPFGHTPRPTENRAQAEVGVRVRDIDQMLLAPKNRIRLSDSEDRARAIRDATQMLPSPPSR